MVPDEPSSPVESSKDAAPRAYHHGDLRRSILDAALADLSAGDDSLSFRALALAAGVARSAPYHHFRDRSELLAVLAGEGFTLLLCNLASAVAGSKDASEALSAMAQAYVGFGRSHAAHYRVMFLPVVTRADNVGHVHPSASACFASLVTVLRRIDKNCGSLASDRARAIWSALHGVVTLGQEGGPLNPEASATPEAFVNGVVAILAGATF